MPLTLDAVLTALERTGHPPKQNSSGWQALCPAHDDKTSSLSVDAGDKQAVVITCHAGCSYEEVIGALGLDAPQRHMNGRGRKTVEGNSKPAPSPQPLPEGPAVTSWVYTDADGDPLMAAVRRDTREGKRITQWTPREGGWVPKGPKGKRPLYGLPAILAKPDAKVVVVEGEKCVDVVREVWPSELVTTWAGGCKAWKKTDWTPLTGREVSILADADGPGRKCARAIAARLHGQGCTVKLGLPEGDSREDVADWLAEGKDAASERIEKLLEPYEGPSLSVVDLPMASGSLLGESEKPPRLGLYGGEALGLEPLADARRLLDSHAGELLAVRGGGGSDERTLVFYVLDGSGVWSRDRNRIAAWHDESAELWQIAAEQGGNMTAVGLAQTYLCKAREPAGVSRCLDSLPVLVTHMLGLGEQPDELSVCEGSMLDGLRYLGSASGVVDLKDGRLLPPEEGRLALVTQTLPDPFDPNATHPDVEQLTAHLPEELAGYLWKALGYALHGIPARTFLLIVGETGGGKSTLAKAVQASLGPAYAGALADGAITPQRGGRGANNATPDLESIMAPRRLAFSAEVENLKPDVARLKAVTGGDLQAWRRLYENLQYGVPTATVALMGNKPPEYLGLDDPALLERIRAVPYPAIEKSARNDRLFAAFESDDSEAVKRRQALIARLVKETSLTKTGSPPAPPGAVKSEIDRLRDLELGEVGVWLRDHVHRADGCLLTTASLKQAISDALGAEGEDAEWRVDGLSWQKLVAQLRRLHDMGPVGSVRPPGGEKERGWNGWRVDAN